MRKSVCAGQGERTLAPHCRQSAARFTLTFFSSRCPRQQVPIRAERCEHIVLCPTHSPRCRWTVALRLRPSRSISRESVNTCGSRLAIDGVSQAHTAYSACSSTLGYALRSNPNSTIAASPMLDKSLVNAYGSPAHTLVHHSLATLPTLHRPSTSPNHEIKAQAS